MPNNKLSKPCSEYSCEAFLWPRAWSGSIVSNGEHACPGNELSGVGVLAVVLLMTNCLRWVATCFTPNSEYLGSIVIDKLEKEKPIRFSSPQLKTATKNYRNKLGSGGFGAVYKASFADGTIAAVKVLSGFSDKRIEEQFMAERDERRRLNAAKEQLASIKYHPLQNYSSASGRVDECGIKRKKLKKEHTNCDNKRWLYSWRAEDSGGAVWQESRQTTCPFAAWDLDTKWIGKFLYGVQDQVEDLLIEFCMKHKVDGVFCMDF